MAGGTVWSQNISGDEKERFTGVAFEPEVEHAGWARSSRETSSLMQFISVCAKWHLLCLSCSLEDLTCIHISKVLLKERGEDYSVIKVNQANPPNKATKNVFLKALKQARCIGKNKWNNKEFK